jgi:hypothetical protein
MVSRRVFFLTCGVVTACNVSAAPATTGGVHLEGGAGDAAADAATAACPAALVVADTKDFTSTNISVLSPEGAIQSASIISSASAPVGLSTPLSGDVVLPLWPTPGHIVLIDRGNAALTWVDPATAAVKHQLSVGTGYASNPQDYLELSPTKAYVTRYEPNPTPGAQPFDGGSDVLIVDPETVTVTGRVPFSTTGNFLPRPARMVHVGSEVWVSLERFDADFKTAGDAQVVGISTTNDTIAWTLDLPGLANCGGIARSPSGKVVALACGGISTDTDPKQRSGIVLVNATAHPPVELKRFSVATALGAPLDSTLAYGSEDVLLGVVVGDAMAGRNDVAYSVDVASGTPKMILDGGMPFVLGDVRCAPGCSDLCFLTDANTNVLRSWKVTGASLAAQASLPVDPTLGIPPRALGSI